MSLPAGIAAGAAGNLSGSALADLLTGRSADILAELARITNLLTAANAYAAIERERTAYPYNLGPGMPALRTNGPLRLVALSVSGAPGDELALRTGTLNVYSFIQVSGDVQTIAVPMLLGPGTDVSVVDVTTPAATNWTAYLWAYHDRGNT